MTISALALNRATLARQLLLERSAVGAEEAVRRVVALQAQQPASPYVALWNRVAEFEARELDAAFAEFRVVKSTLMRITLHAVHVDDYRDFRAAVEPTVRGARLRDRRFTASGLTESDAARLLPELLARAEVPCGAGELGDWLAERGGGIVPELARPAWRMLRQWAPLWHAPDAGLPWRYTSGAGQRFFAADGDRRPELGDPEAVAEGLRVLLRRYLEGFGPASVADMAQFGLVQKGRVREALARCADLVRLEGPGGEVLYDVPGGPLPDEGVRAPARLMAMWDSTLLAYADRGRVLPAEYRKVVTRVNGDVLPTVLVDGYVAGVWRVGPAGAGGEGIEVAAFRELPEAAWEELAGEARGLLKFLGERDLGAYRRYDHWWVKGLPVAERRVLPG
ncbi:winged helix DNA-binding domain-containing protein [Streptomyces sp. VRA16 Mangrove soil]|uniref:winged helix DNA-binding domain-containing protein n=1 Tax=Streptomyces sp. VRA16 Mangrove soil TaxID=2817434 RepID=UPI001A9D97B7|nr:winged helix DNA-binding domain-containing protein [Streptomyces sp. VRA16 Mangrove soil]MBO1337115.1 AlkZ family DNA glycosylase [Streptomyces sp. VRA16 Mangrove soil]